MRTWLYFLLETVYIANCAIAAAVPITGIVREFGNHTFGAMLVYVLAAGFAAIYVPYLRKSVNEVIAYTKCAPSWSKRQSEQTTRRAGRPPGKFTRPRVEM